MSLTSDEIASQPALWDAAIGAAPTTAGPLRAPGERVLFLGCGTSAFVAQALAALRERAGLGVSDWCYASEPLVDRGYDRVVAITRSGTTTEVLDALAACPARTRRVVVTGVDGEVVDSYAQERVLLADADEQSVVQTRFPTTLLALARAGYGEDVAHLPGQARTALSRAVPPVGEHVVFLGRGWTVGLAHEAALKMREAAHVPAESYPALDYRHGPIALATTGSYAWALAELPDRLRADIEATGAVVHEDGLDPLASLVLAQRVAMAVAARKDLDPDNPRHLTRSVVLTTGSETRSS